MTNKIIQNSEIYGITGEKGHGKDTFARLIMGINPLFQVTHFGGHLKQIAERVFGLTNDQMNDPTLKEAPLKKPITMDLFLEGLRRETSLPIQPRNKVGYSPREVMQYLGTEYIRSVQGDYWVHQVLRSIEGHHHFLVPDARFNNEVDGIRSIGGRIIKILRIDAPPSGDKHISETGCAKIIPDLTLGARTGDFSLLKLVAQLIATNNFDAALRYDYNIAEQTQFLV
jgi:hypothetical protein